MKRKLFIIILVFTLTFTLVTAGTFSSFAFSKACGEYAGKIVILHSNNVHGAIDGYQYMAGLRLSTQQPGLTLYLPMPATTSRARYMSALPWAALLLI